MKTPTLPRGRIAVALACLVLCATGCASQQQKSTGDISSIGAEQKIGPGGLSADEIQSLIMGYADTYTAYVRQAIDEVMSNELTPAARANAYRAKLTSVYGAITIASSPNSVVAVMDMVVLVTLERMVVDDHWVKLEGDLLLPVVRALKTAEAEIRELAAQVLWPEQLQELDELIVRWRADHPDQVIVNTIRLSELSQYRRQVRDAGGKQRSSIFSFFYVDPLANLDPATREIKRTRELTERVFFYSERVPVMLNWMMRSLYYDLAAAAEMQQLMANATKVAGVSERYAEEFEALPGVIAREREAAITQFMDGLADQRRAFMDDLSGEEQRLRGTLGDLKETIEAGTELSASVDALVARFERGPGEPPREPFDIREYRQAAVELAGTARELDALVKSVDQLVATARPGEDDPLLVTTFEAAEAGGARLIDLAFKRALIVVAALTGGSVAVVLVWYLLPRGAAR